MVAGARQSLPWKKKAERTKEQERRNRIRRWWPPHWNGAVRGVAMEGSGIHVREQICLDWG